MKEQFGLRRHYGDDPPGYRFQCDGTLQVVAKNSHAAKYGKKIKVARQPAGGQKVVLLDIHEAQLFPPARP
jgi:hypothetical protein